MAVTRGHNSFKKHPLPPTQRIFYAFSTRVKTLSSWVPRTERKVWFHFSSHLSQLETQSHPQSQDEMLIPDWKKKQCGYFHSNKA